MLANFRIFVNIDRHFETALQNVTLYAAGMITRPPSRTHPGTAMPDAAPLSMSDPVLEMRDFRLVFDTYRGTVQALEGVDLTIYPGECVGIVGETGCGKSATARAMLGFVDKPGRVTGGSIKINGRDILKLRSREMRRLRGREIAFIFQEAKKALNPTVTVGTQLLEAVQAHQRVPRKEALERVHEALRQVGLADPDRLMDSYAFELSGGMAQRVMIAIAIVGNANVLVADEPTSALDVSIQAQVLAVLRQAREVTGSALFLITHDLGVAAENCDRIAVMYAGRVVENGTVEDVFSAPSHPYTARLLAALPSAERETLEAIPGTVPDLVDPPPGCRFANRCEKATQLCVEQRPPMSAIAGRRQQVACHHPLVSTKPARQETMSDG